MPDSCNFRLKTAKFKIVLKHAALLMLTKLLQILSRVFGEQSWLIRWNCSAKQSYKEVNSCASTLYKSGFWKGKTKQK